MLKKIRIEGNYFEMTVDGKTYEVMGSGLLDRHGIQFWGVYNQGKSFTVQIRSRTVKPNSPFPYGVPSGELDGSAVVSLSDGSPWPWITWAPSCGIDYIKSFINAL